MCAQDATKPTDLASTLAHKDDSETDDRLEKFMKTGSISTWVLLQVYYIVGFLMVTSFLPHPAVMLSQSELRSVERVSGPDRNVI